MGRGTTAKGCLRAGQLLERHRFYSQNTGDHLTGMPHPRLPPRTTGIFFQTPKSRTQTQSPNPSSTSPWQKQTCSGCWEPRPGSRGCAPALCPPQACPTAGGGWGGRHLSPCRPFHCPAPAASLACGTLLCHHGNQLLGSLRRDSTSHLGEGRPVPCPVSHSSAQPGPRVLSLKPASHHPEISAPPHAQLPPPPAPSIPTPQVHLWHHPPTTGGGWL